MVTEFARAKVNLALHVTGRRADGYHLLDSAVAFADAAGDVLTVSPLATGPSRLDVTGPFAQGLENESDNLVLRAADKLGRIAPDRVPACAFELEKRLPVASGIGGGSADAAAALRAVIRLAGISVPRDRLAAAALELGADVPVCIDQSACRMSGIGEVIAPMPRFPGLDAVLVNPRRPVSTAAIFRDLGIRAGSDAFAPMPPLPVSGLAHDWLDWLSGCRNDLELPARRLEPAIATVIDTLSRSDGCRIARMSGSGATCFGLYETAGAAAAAAEAMSAARPGWWVAPTRLV